MSSRILPVSAALLAASLSSSAFALSLEGAFALKGSKVAAEINLMARGAAAGEIVVSALAASNQGKQLLFDLEALGLKHGAAAGRLVTGILPLSAVPKLESLASLHSVRPSYALFHAAGSSYGPQGFTVSQGDKEMYADKARQRFGVDGTGVMVGVLSNAYNCHSGFNTIYSPNGDDASDIVASGDLPQGVLMLEDLNKPAGGTGCISRHHGIPDEGRAMMEVVHDLAPGAALAFHTSGNGEADFAAGIKALADAGARVIVDDTTYLDEPVYQDGGPIADAAREAVGRGVAYVSAAGNFGRLTYEAPFHPSGVAREIGGKSVELHDFSTTPGVVDTCQKVALYSNDYYTALALHWDQPYASIGNGPGASTDLDLYLMDENCQAVLERYDSDYSASPPYPEIVRVGMGAANNIGGDPVETLKIALNDDSGSESTHTYGLAIGRVAGPAPGRMRLTFGGENQHINFVLIDKGNMPVQSARYATSGATLFGHANLAEVMTVGATRAQVVAIAHGFAYTLEDTGIRPTEPFSALGGTDILFDAHGLLLPQPAHRQKPDVAGEDGVDNRSSDGQAIHRTGYPSQVFSFFGTSAAAAHVAGLVALAKQAKPDATPAQIGDALRQSAHAVDDTIAPTGKPGFNYATGYGLADGENLIARLTGQKESSREGGGGDPGNGGGQAMTLAQAQKWVATATATKLKIDRAAAKTASAAVKAEAAAAKAKAKADAASGKPKAAELKRAADLAAAKAVKLRAAANAAESARMQANQDLDKAQAALKAARTGKS